MKTNTSSQNNQKRASGISESNTRVHVIALVIREAIENNHPIPFSDLQRIDPQKPVDYADNSTLLQALIGH